MNQSKSLFKNTPIELVLAILLLGIYLLILLIFKTDLIFPDPITTPESTVNFFISKCGNGDRSKTCYQKQFLQLAETHDITYIAAVLEKLQLKSPISNCHLVSHLVGQKEMRENPKELEKIIQEINPNLCEGGFMHGIIEEHSRITKKETIDSEVIRKACSFTRAVDPRNIHCIHTLGHLIYLNTNGDLEKGIKICETLTPGIERKSYMCYNGLFMEHTTKQNTILHDSDAKNISITAKDVISMEKLCRTLKNFAATTCWEEIGRFYLKINKHDVSKAFQQCSRAGEYQISCQYYLGVLTVRAGNKLGSGVQNFCSQFRTKKEKESCQLFLLPNILFNNPTSAPYAINFCSHSPEQIQDICFIKIGSILSKILSQVEITTYCASAPEIFRSKCTFENI